MDSRTFGPLVAATVVIGAAIVALLLVQFSVIQAIVGIPVFLLLVSVYITAVGLTTATPDAGLRRTYYLAWGGIMLIIGLLWVLLYYGVGIIWAVVAALLLTLAYLYLNRAKSGK